MKSRINDKLIWDEIYKKENFTPGWVTPGIDKYILEVSRTYTWKKVI